MHQPAKALCERQSSNVCGIEFNYDNEEKEEQEEQEEDDTNSLVGADLAASEMYYNNQILRQLFLGFQVASEVGRSVLQC